MTEDLHHREQIAEWFAALLKSYGLPVVRHEDWVTLGGRLPAFRGAYLPPAESGVAGAVSVQIGLPGHKVINEQVIVAKPEAKEAIEHGLFLVAGGMFHPVIAACHDVAPPEFVRAVDSEDREGPVRAYYGNLAANYTGAEAPDTPEGWAETALSAIAGTTLEDGLNWVSISAARAGENEAQLRVRLNNEDWAAGHEALSAVDWPKEPDGFVGVCGLMLVRKGELPAKPAGDVTAAEGDAGDA